MRTDTHTTRSIPLVILLAGAVLVSLLGGAVVSTASAAQLSFQAGALQQQQFQMKQHEQLLQEKLADAQSLKSLQQYADANGFTENAHAVASLDLAPALAQLP